MKRIEEISKKLTSDLLTSSQCWSDCNTLYNTKVEDIAQKLAGMLDLEQQVEALQANSHLYQMLELIGTDLITGWGVGCKAEPQVITEVLSPMFKKGNFACLGFHEGSSFKDFLGKYHGFRPRTLSANREESPVQSSPRPLSI